MISETLNTLHDDGSFEPLTQAIAAYQTEATDEKMLIANFIRSQMKLRKLSDTIRGCAEDEAQRLYHIKESIDDADLQINVS